MRETCTSGSEGGPRKRTGRNPDTAPRSDPYTEHPLGGQVSWRVVIDAFSPQDRRLADRPAHAHQPRLRCPQDGALAPPPTGWDRRLRTRIIDRPTHRGPSGADSVVPACSAPWDPSVNASTTPWQRASSAPSSSSCSTSITGRAATNSAQAIFEWIETWYNPRRRHSYCQMLSPVDYEATHTA